MNHSAGQLTKLQHQVGNQAVQHVLTHHTGQGSLKLDQATILRLTREHGSLAQAIVQKVVGTENQVQRDEADGPQAQAGNGAVTIADVKYEYYDVSGSTLAEVGQQLDPEEWGRCRYDYDYSYDAANGRTTKVDITLRLTIRLPRWRGKGWDKASPAAKREWQRMLEALQGHEEEHAEIARRWGPVFKERLLNQRESNLRRRYNQARQDVNQETRQFDDRTRHGQTQGVSLDTSIQ